MKTITNEQIAEISKKYWENNAAMNKIYEATNDDDNAEEDVKDNANQAALYNIGYQDALVLVSNILHFDFLSAVKSDGKPHESNLTKAQELEIIKVYKDCQSEVYDDDAVADEICSGEAVADVDAYSRGYDNGSYERLQWIVDLLKIDVNAVQDNTTFQILTNLPQGCDIQKIKEEFADIVYNHGGEVITVSPSEDDHQKSVEPEDTVKIHENNLKQFNDEPKIRCIAYGCDETGYFVQSCCNEPHLGQECGCRTFGKHLSKEDAEKLAEEKAQYFNVPIEKW